MTGSTDSESRKAVTSRVPTARIARFTNEAGVKIVAVREQPIVVRYTHWISAITIPILIASGIQIFFAFPSLGPKIPQHNLINIPQEFHPLSLGSWLQAIALGRWLAGAERWHFAFMWILIATGAVYVAYEIFSGRYKKVLFVPRDVRGVWPVIKHYFLFGDKPRQTEQYNPLQKLAYTATVFLGALSLLSGFVMFNPVQFSWLGWLMGGFHYARIWHFIAMWGFLAFIPGHLIMIIIHGWHNFIAMLTGWKKNPEYHAE